MSRETPKMAIRTSSKPLATQFDILFDDNLGDPSSYHEEIYMMRQGNEGDQVVLHINSGGGALVTFSTIQHVMKNSPAHFHAILEGDASSAASMLFLIADSQEVADHAEMMIHQAQVGYGSHAQGFKGAADMIAYQNEKLIREVYEDFLDEEEIEKVLNGGEIWLHADQIRERLQQRQTIREQRVVDDMKSQYTQEYYVQEILPDIAEDCEGLGYDLKQVLQMLLQSVENLEDGCTEISLDEVEGTQDIDVLKSVAKVIELKHPHNIGIEKLRDKILNQLED